MTVHKMKLTPGPFEKIASGKKIIESRLYDEKRQQIVLGDQIEFICSDDSTKNILTNVLALYRYKNFSELFSAFPVAYFGGSSKEELQEEIQRFYSKENEEKYGVLGIKIQVEK